MILTPLFRYCKLDINSGEWECVICDHKNVTKGVYSPTGSYPELVKHVFEFTTGDDDVGKILDVPNRTCVFALDANILQEEMKVWVFVIVTTK